MKKLNYLSSLRREWIFFTFIAMILLLAFNACNKDQKTNESAFKKHAPTSNSKSRDGFSVTKSWLIDFQSNAALAVANTTIPDSYSVDEMVAGVEALINLAVPATENATVPVVDVSLIQVSLSNTTQALKYIYQQSYSAHLTHYSTLDSTETFPVALSLTVDSVVSNLAYIKITSVFGISNASLETKYPNSNAECSTAFGDEEAFRIGAGDKSLEIMNFYHNPGCSGGCGDAASNEPGPNTALEEVETRLNYYYPKPRKSGECFVGFIDIKSTGTDYLENDIYYPCNIFEYEIGTCLKKTSDSYDPLECMYCAIRTFIEEHDDPFYYPVESYFIRVNLGADYCGCSGNGICAELTAPVGEYWFGTPVFKTGPPVLDDPLEVDITLLDF